MPPSSPSRVTSPRWWLFAAATAVAAWTLALYGQECVWGETGPLLSWLDGQVPAPSQYDGWLGGERPAWASPLCLAAFGVMRLLADPEDHRAEALARAVLAALALACLPVSLAFWLGT